MQVVVSLNWGGAASTDVDVDNLEQAVVEAGRRAMVVAMEAAFREHEDGVRQCPHCQSARLQRQGTDRRVLLCQFGRVELQLSRQRCCSCGRLFRPADGLLCVLGGRNITTSLKQAAILAGASWPAEEAADVLRELAGAQISGESVRQLTNEGGKVERHRQTAEAQAIVSPTGKEVRAERARELAGRLAEADDGVGLLMVGLDGGWVPSREQAGGMEGKVGVVASAVEPLGGGRRRLSRRQYVATFGDSEDIGVLTYAAAYQLGAERAERQVVIGDGAAWIKTQAQWHFPAAVKILDWAHLARAVHKAIRAARPGKGRKEERRLLHRQLEEQLWHGEVDAALEGLVGLRPAEGEEAVMRLEEAISYVREQRSWLGNYKAWRQAGYPVGSGLVERAVALVINRRLKRQGGRWRRVNADAVVALRVQILNRQWEHHATRRLIA